MRCNPIRARSILAGLFLATTCSVCLAQQAQVPITSPEVSGEGNVTFRLRAPNAKSVKLASAGDIPVIPFRGGLDMSKSPDGIFDITVESLDPGSYRYAFIVDGLTVLDPSNRSTSESNRNAWSLVDLPGSSFMDTTNVPHGAVSDVHYFSAVLQRTRRMHVYTPPGYQRGDGTYPVFYLLHGAMDSDDSWSSVGRASFILDNLIAAGTTEPMVVVMPDGHTEPFIMGSSALSLDKFAREFATDIKPFVESNYRVKTDRDDTAIGGLSMGGGHALEISMNALDEYGYIGVFSSGVFSVLRDSSWQDKHSATLKDKDIRKGLKIVWFATGSEDFLLETTKATVSLLDGYGFDVEYEESTGGHTWINWRQYLRDFSPRLFKETAAEN
jgi:enterochelin esterase-like enzyme